MFPFLPFRLLTGHNAETATGWLSPRLWGRVAEAMKGGLSDKRLYMVGDDFVGVHHAGTVTDLHSAYPYVVYADDTTNHTVAGSADNKGGVLNMTIDAGAGGNEEIGIELGDGTQQLGQISDTAADAHLTAFECRIKWKAVTTGATWTNGEFVSAFGLLGPGSNDGDVLTDTTGIPTAANRGVGFHIPLDDANTVNFYYEADSQTRVDAISDIGAPVDDTFMQFGFIYDPDAVSAKRITVYVDNVASSTYVTGTNIETATFPDAEALNFVAATKVVTASKSVEMAIDWWAFAQLI